MKLPALSILVCSAIIAGSCTLAPEYQRPSSPVPASWPSGPAYQKLGEKEQNQTAAGELKWQEFFPDEKLRKVIDIALTENRDLRISALNVELLRALYGIQSAALYPAVYANGTMLKSRASGPLTQPDQDRISERYAVNLGLLSWELDFFGRLRSLKEQALEEYLASEEGRRSAQITLVSGVALAYLTLAADHDNLTLAETTYQAQKSTFEMVQRQYALGVANELSLRQAQTQVETARRAIARYTQRVAEDENSLTLLLGGSPVPKELLALSLDQVRPPAGILPGTSSEVLLSRPDVLQAEHGLKAVNANLGAARAAFFPSISLSSTIGTASDQLSGLFSGGSGTWAYGPEISMPIFDPRTWSALDAAKVQRELAVAQYEKAIQQAFREVADALSVSGTIGEQLAAQQSLVDSLSEVLRLSLRRFEKGVDSYLSVLDAQRFLFAAQQELILVRLASVASKIQLYAALGGGAEGV